MFYVNEKNVREHNYNLTMLFLRFQIFRMAKRRWQFPVSTIMTNLCHHLACTRQSEYQRKVLIWISIRSSCVAVTARMDAWWAFYAALSSNTSNWHFICVFPGQDKMPMLAANVGWRKVRQSQHIATGCWLWIQAAPRSCADRHLRV